MTHVINRGMSKNGHPIARAEAFADEERKESIRKEKAAASMESKVKSTPKRVFKAKLVRSVMSLVITLRTQLPAPK